MVTIKISINYQIKLKKKSLPTCFPVPKIAFSLGVFHPLFRSVNMPGVSQKTNSHFRHQYQRCPNITPQGSAKSVSPFSRCVSWTDFSKGPFAPSVSIHVLRVLTSHPLHHVIECPPLHWNCSYYHHEWLPSFQMWLSTVLSCFSGTTLLFWFHDIILTPGFPSDFLVVPLQAYLQMLFSVWSSHLSLTTLNPFPFHAWLLNPHIPV